MACPHCGTHLSIPAPEPEPAPVTPPQPVAAPPSEPVPEIRFEVPQTFAAATAPEIAVVADQLNAMPEAPVFSAAAASVPTSDSLHDGTDESQAVPTSVGWHSAPNLYLTPEVPTSSSTAISQPPVLFAAPPPTEPTETTAPQPPVTFAAAAEPMPASEPAWNFAAITSPPPEPAAPTTGFEPQGAPSFVPAAPPQTAQPDPLPATQFMPAPTSGQESFPAASSQPVFANAPTVEFQQPLTFGAAPAVAAAPQLTFGAASPTAATPAPASLNFTAAPASVPTFNAAPSAARTTPAVPASTVAGDAAAFAENESVSRQKFLLMLLIIVGSYASAVTLVLVYMLIFSRTSALESLPDLKPPMNKNGEISWQYNPPVNNVAPGHVLSLGQSRRFGNVKVTPLKVTRGPVKFEHYAGLPGAARLPSEPVLKLWVKFENVSRNQTFAPLDPQLLFTRDVRNLGENIRANGFVTTESDRKKGKPLFYFFDIPVLSEFRIIGQNLNRDLAPGESVESFVPSEEDALNLKGDLVWRFQFRKGYHPKSMRGVTTLIDVRFNSKDIVDERA